MPRGEISDRSGVQPLTSQSGPLRTSILHKCRVTIAMNQHFSLRMFACVTGIAVCTSAPAEHVAVECSQDAQLVAACFNVRGRLSFSNGTPSARIWPVGTHRLLGVHRDILPDDVQALMQDFDDEVWATFTVCPYTREKAGAMRFVCIAEARNMRHTRRDAQ